MMTCDTVHLSAYIAVSAILGLIVGDWVGSTRERLRVNREARRQHAAAGLPKNTTGAPLGVVRGGRRR